MQRATKTINNTTTPIIRQILNKGVHYHVDDTTAMKSSHELSQKNPILRKQWTSGITNNSFQHPTIGRITCEKRGCENKICDKPCGTIKEKTYVGHITHSDKYGTLISYKDFNNKNNAQYYQPYNPPVKNYDTTGENTNESRTNNLNYQNTEARTLIHIYNTHNPLDE